MLEKNVSINYMNFNQTGTCISMGTSNGFLIFNCAPFGKFYSEDSGGYGIVEMLFSTSLLALVGIGDQPMLSPRRLRIINTKKHSIICEVTFPTKILSVKMNRSRLVVVLKEQIYVYDINNMKLLHTIETSPNSEGLVSLCSQLESNYLAYPSPPKIINSEIKPNVNTNTLNITSNKGRSADLSTSEAFGSGNDDSFSRNEDQEEDDSLYKYSNDPSGELVENNVKNGDVILYDLNTLQPLMVIEAHKGEIAALAFSFDGSLIATASDKGTIIRVFNTSTGSKLYQFRRGTYPTKIYSLSFSQDNMFLTVTCSTKTVHIFKLWKTNAADADSDDSNNYDDMNDSNDNRDDNSATGIDTDGESIKEPYVDASRKTMGRMIRNSSQKISRQAAKTLGQLFPIKVTSILEPSRHFASLKLPNDSISSSSTKTLCTIGKEIEVNKSEYPELFDPQDTNQKVTMLPIRVLSSDGYLYNYVLDPERGGDCLLLSQYSTNID
ncbi:Autophagy-related protein 18 [Nakaseomyces bracarensis]|uniref:Autophagy-related protein 18 n=1 Tax=Nakaseomyces bracarensis TaxID=273131 RepID=A0ABR4NU95_9SACH